MIWLGCTVVIACMARIGRDASRGRWWSASLWSGFALVAALAVKAQLPAFPPAVLPRCPTDVPGVCR